MESNKSCLSTLKLNSIVMSNWYKLKLQELARDSRIFSLACITVRERMKSKQRINMDKRVDCGRFSYCWYVVCLKLKVNKKNCNFFEETTNQLMLINNIEMYDVYNCKCFLGLFKKVLLCNLWVFTVYLRTFVHFAKSKVYKSSQSISSFNYKIISRTIEINFV